MCSQPLFICGYLGCYSIFCPVLPLLAGISATCVYLTRHTYHLWGFLVSLYMHAHISSSLQACFSLLLFSFCLSCTLEGFQLGLVDRLSTLALQIPPRVLPGRAPGRHGGEARCRQPANAALFMSCSLVQTAVWGELGKFVWHKALKLTKDCRAWAVIDKTRGI